MRPFLANVLRGRRVPPERVEEVAHHYELFGGVSPLTELTMRQAELLRAGSSAGRAAAGLRRHAQLASVPGGHARRDVARRACGARSGSSPRRSAAIRAARSIARTSTRRARRSRERGLADVEVTYVGDWHTHPGFVDANAEHVREALAHAARRRARSRAHRLHGAQHSGVDGRALSVSAAAAKRRPRGRGARQRERPRRDWALVYQSRSGRPEDPWLGPDVCDYLREEHARGPRGGGALPVGFLCDHIEVLYDLDVEAAAVCREIGLPMVRARAVNDHPRFVDTMADAVIDAIERYRGGRPLRRGGRAVISRRPLPAWALIAFALSRGHRSAPCTRSVPATTRLTAVTGIKVGHHTLDARPTGMHGDPRGARRRRRR